MVSPMEREILAAVQKLGQATAGEIAANLACSPHTLLGDVVQLEQNGYIRRLSANEGDPYVVVTDRGRREVAFG